MNTKIWALKIKRNIICIKAVESTKTKYQGKVSPETWIGFKLRLTDEPPITITSVPRCHRDVTLISFRH